MRQLQSENSRDLTFMLTCSIELTLPRGNKIWLVHEGTRTSAVYRDWSDHLHIGWNFTFEGVAWGNFPHFLYRCFLFPCNPPATDCHLMSKICKLLWVLTNNSDCTWNFLSIMIQTQTSVVREPWSIKCYLFVKAITKVEIKRKLWYFLTSWI